MITSAMALSAHTATHAPRPLPSVLHPPASLRPDISHKTTSIWIRSAVGITGNVRQSSRWRGEPGRRLVTARENSYVIAFAVGDAAWIRLMVEVSADALTDLSASARAGDGGIGKSCGSAARNRAESS